ncbi:MAG: single-stranded DNA-binding protein [Bacteroidales bacterium]|nr:single-stranded DNA-binding protein [Bacteroidales bacterium]
MSVNKVILVGNVGKDPIVRYTNENVPVASFTLATNEIYRDQKGELKKETEWHNIVAWRNNAQLAEKFIKKGTQLYIEGRIKSRTYTDKENQTRNVYEIIADKIQLLGKKEETTDTSSTSIDASSESIVTPIPKDLTEDINNTISSSATDDDLPF